MGDIQDLESDEKNNKIFEFEQVKQCLCRIENKNGIGAGFFCIIPYQNTSLKVMITTHTLINDDILKNDKQFEILMTNDNEETYKIIKINDNRKIYTSLKYNTTIIEIEPNSDDIHKFLQLDENILKEYITYEKISIIQYINHTKKINKTISEGKITQINDYNIKYSCNSTESIPGCPLLNQFNEKVIGMHIESLFNFNNRGIILKNPINIFINDIISTNTKNEIYLKIKIEKKDINQKIYFLYGDKNNYYTSYIKGGRFSSYCPKVVTQDLDNSVFDVFINNIKYDHVKYFIPQKEGLYDIKIQFFDKIKDCSNLFYSCENIISIDLSFFDSSNITDTSEMFMLCKNLEKIDFTSFDTKNVTDMNGMFDSCYNLSKINLSFFNTKKVTDMCHMFNKCYNLKNLYLSSFDTENLINMKNMFSDCHSLLYIDLSNFNTQNVEDISFLFYKCYSLVKLDLSTINIINIKYFDNMLSHCYSLIYVKLTSFQKRFIGKDSINCINLLQ